MEINNLRNLSTGQPTYWPTDTRKNPDVIDFCVTKEIANKYLRIESSLDLSSDHTPIIVSLSSQIIMNDKPTTLRNKRTDRNTFRDILESKLSTEIPLKSNADIDAAVQFLTYFIQEAAWDSTLDVGPTDIHTENPDFVMREVAEKRTLRRI